MGDLPPIIETELPVLGELDAAWRAAEEAKEGWFQGMLDEDPEGEFFEAEDIDDYGIRLEGQSNGKPDGYTAMLMDWTNDYVGGVAEADGPTPAAALLALAEKLRSTP